MKVIIGLILLFSLPATAQNLKEFTRYDSLRGSEGKYRQYDVTFYNLDLTIFPKSKSIKGSNTIYFTSKAALPKIQIDLSKKLSIDSIVFHNELLTFERDSDFVFVELPGTLPESRKDSLTIFYSGQPKESQNPPWDGGVVWSKDSLGRTWAAVACEGLGASSWWPCQDSWDDEADSIKTSFTVPQPYQCISNGELISERTEKGSTTYNWLVNYPINNYNVTFNIGSYSHFSDTLKRANGSTLPLDYYVLDYNKQKAGKHFEQVPTLLKEFEILFGPYPFPKDGYALVESPFWGMEHQSAIAYGNNYKNKFYDYDYIIAHETGHEWWGNNVTARDHGDMWIHEAFTTYSEALLVERLYSYQTAVEYLNHQKTRILNKAPIKGPKGVNYHYYDDTDQYFKGTWMLHTIRNVINNDSLWFGCLKAMQKEFRHQTVTGEQVVQFISRYTGKDLSKIFEQYTDHSELPILIYKIQKEGNKSIVKYKWESPVEGLEMPVELLINNKPVRVTAKESTYSIYRPQQKIQSIKVNKDKYLVREREK